MKQITKQEFFKIATSEGLGLLGAKGCTLDEGRKTCMDNAYKDFSSIEKIICSVKGQHLVRGTSNLHLDKHDKVFKICKFIVVYSFIPAGNGANFDSHNCIFYI